MTDLIVDAVLRGVLGGRRKKGRSALTYLTRRGRGGGRGGGALGNVLANPQTLLTAAGVAWGIFETMQQSASAGGGTAGDDVRAAAGSGGSGAAAPVGGLPPLPGGSGADDRTRMIQLAASAARADGTLGDDERAAIVDAAGAEAGALVAHELATARPLAEILAGVSDPAARATLYVLAYTVVRADEQVSGAERIYLAQVANLLGLDPAAVQQLERDTARRIDAQAHQG